MRNSGPSPEPMRAHPDLTCLPADTIGYVASALAAMQAGQRLLTVGWR